MRRETLRRLVATIEEYCGPQPGLAESTRVDGLGLDSLDLEYLHSEVELAFERDITDEQWEACETIGDVVTLLDTEVAR